MKKYVLDIKYGLNAPTYGNGDFTLVFDTLSNLFNWIKRSRILACRFRITSVEFDANDTPIQGTATDFVRTDVVVFDTTYNLVLKNSSGTTELAYECKTKAEVKNKLKKFYPIVNGSNVASTGKVVISKEIWNLSTTGQVYGTLETIDVADL